MQGEIYITKLMIYLIVSLYNCVSVTKAQPFTYMSVACTTIILKRMCDQNKYI